MVGWVEFCFALTQGYTLYLSWPQTHYVMLSKTIVSVSRECLSSLENK